MQQQNQGTLYDFISKREYSKDEYRFMMDLEFVQDLSNVFYLKCTKWSWMGEWNRPGRQQVLRRSGILGVLEVSAVLEEARVLALHHVIVQCDCHP
mgnify:FL=1